MTFKAENNDIALYDNTTGACIFNTRGKLPHIASVVSGSITLPARSRPVSQSTVYYDLGPVHPGAEFVAGSLRLESAYYVMNETLYTRPAMTVACSGTYLLATGMYSIRTLTPIITGGRLYLMEQFVAEISTYIPFFSQVIHYKIYVGLMTTAVTDPGALPTININDGYENYNQATNATEFRFTWSIQGGALYTGARITYTTSPGTMAPPYYTHTSGVIDIAPGQTSGVIWVKLGTSFPTLPENTFYVTLSNPEYLLIGRAQGQGTIWGIATPG